tara:strand:+ start:773 stop:1075 length:303 start_codon:yes stop_codon:yes gene_type:complete
MEETIVKIVKATAKHKKYSAIVRNKTTKKERKINFGDDRYENFKDSTPLKLYASKNHGDKKRRKNYFMRHSGVPTKAQAVAKEKAKGVYTPKLLSHIYLW